MRWGQWWRRGWENKGFEKEQWENLLVIEVLKERSSFLFTPSSLLFTLTSRHLQPTKPPRFPSNMTTRGLEHSKKLPRPESTSSKSDQDVRGTSHSHSPPPTSKELETNPQPAVNPQEEPELSRWTDLPEFPVGKEKLKGAPLNWAIVSWEK